MTGRTEPGPHLEAFRAGKWPVDAADMEGRKMRAAFSWAGTRGPQTLWVVQTSRSRGRLAFQQILLFNAPFLSECSLSQCSSKLSVQGGRELLLGRQSLTDTLWLHPRGAVPFVFNEEVEFLLRASEAAAAASEMWGRGGGGRGRMKWKSTTTLQLYYCKYSKYGKCCEYSKYGKYCK